MRRARRVSIWGGDASCAQRIRSRLLTLDLPDLGIFGRHSGLVEAGVEHEHGHALGLELLREEHRADVARRAAHVVAVVAALVLVLGEAPFRRARL